MCLDPDSISRSSGKDRCAILPFSADGNQKSSFDWGLCRACSRDSSGAGDCATDRCFDSGRREAWLGLRTRVAADFAGFVCRYCFACSGMAVSELKGGESGFVPLSVTRLCRMFPWTMLWSGKCCGFGRPTKLYTSAKSLSFQRHVMCGSHLHRNDCGRSRCCL